ncbi:MAG: GIY-YIG nuclease family protein [Candidatus Doudnabacteria bacterium]|nr:GIY-YIG nuclease family protein [Candidatus Doudnabacteria bacterium]
MFYIYVLRSSKNNKRYVGSTSKSPEKRTSEHNNGINSFTRHNKPWNLIYQESFTTKSEALKRENFLKSGQGRKWLDENIRE